MALETSVRWLCLLQLGHQTMWSPCAEDQTAPPTSLKLQTMSKKTPEWNPLRHVPQRTIGKTPETRFVWCLQLWKSWNKLAEDHTCCIIIAADQSWGLQAWERAFIFQITQIGDYQTLISFYLKTSSIYWTSLDGLLTGVISFRNSFVWIFCFAVYCLFRDDFGCEMEWGAHHLPKDPEGPGLLQRLPRKLKHKSWTSSEPTHDSHMNMYNICLRVFGSLLTDPSRCKTSLNVVCVVSYRCSLLTKLGSCTNVLSKLTQSNQFSQPGQPKPRIHPNWNGKTCTWPQKQTSTVKLWDDTIKCLQV